MGKATIAAAFCASLAGMALSVPLHAATAGELDALARASAQPATGLALARSYGHWGLRALIRLAHGCIVHSKADWQLFETNYGPMDVRVALVPHGPYDQYRDLQETGDQPPRPQ